MANRIESPETWPTDKSKFQWVEVPAKDMYDKSFPDIHLNTQTYGAGKKHFVPENVAIELRRIIDTFEKANRRLMLPTPDRKAQNDADGNSSSGVPRG